MKKKTAASLKRSSRSRTTFRNTGAIPAKKRPKSSRGGRKATAAQGDLGSVLTQIPAVRQAIDEEAVARNYVLTRYRTLIDRKHLDGLSPQETEELDGLQVTLDDMDEPFYGGIIKRLRALLERGTVA
jgi:hypothetical protein